MKSTFNPSSAAARTLKEIIEDGKVTISMAIEGLEQIEDELNGDLEAGYKALFMSGDLGRQIEMLQALQNKIKRSIGAPIPSPTPAPYSVLESSPT